MEPPSCSNRQTSHKSALTIKLNGYYCLFILLSGIIILASGCKQNIAPKPHGYLRTELPEKDYRLFDSIYPYMFEYPVYGEFQPDIQSPISEPYWSNIYFPVCNATLYLSYKNVNDSLPKLLEHTHKLLYQHAIKADEIIQQEFANPNHKTYGFLYEVGGNAASPLQFYLTDSVTHFLRGSFYFYTAPNRDSLAPMIEYFKEDISHLISTTKWKNVKINNPTKSQLK